MSTAVTNQNKIKTIVNNDSDFTSYYGYGDIYTLDELVPSDLPAVIVTLQTEDIKSIGKGFLSGNPLFNIECIFDLGTEDVETVLMASISKAEGLFTTIKNSGFNVQGNNRIVYFIGVYNGIKVVKISMKFQANK